MAAGSVIVYVAAVCAIAALGRTAREPAGHVRHGGPPPIALRPPGTPDDGRAGDAASADLSNRTSGASAFYGRVSDDRAGGGPVGGPSVGRTSPNRSDDDGAGGALLGVLFPNRTRDAASVGDRRRDGAERPNARSVDAAAAPNRNENVLKVRVVFASTDGKSPADATERTRSATAVEDVDRDGGANSTVGDDALESEPAATHGGEQLPPTHPDGLSVDSAEQLITKQGYAAESHQVETEDGYLLRIHRVPHGRKAHKIKSKSGRRPAVLVHHGLLSSSDIFLLRSAEKDLGYLLAERGYDVWFANSRGNTYSKRHVSMSAADPSFWAFGLHEIGHYDLPAVVDYVLNVTGNSDLFFVGHSMGATISYILCSTRPEYNDKFRLIVSLAPVVYLRPKTLFLNMLSSAVAYFKDVVHSRGTFEVLPQTPFSARLGRALCRDGSVTQSLCLTMIFIMAGVDYEQMNTTLLPKVLAHYPAGTSWQVVMHFHQFILTGEFGQWDYGEAENMKRYRRPRPPPYDFDKVTAPVSIHYGENDFLAPPEDIAKLALKIPNLVGMFKVPHSKFNHLDFLWAKDGRQLLYDFVISLIDKYR